MTQSIYLYWIRFGQETKNIHLQYIDLHAKFIGNNNRAFLNIPLIE